MAARGEQKRCAPKGGKRSVKARRVAREIPEKRSIVSTDAFTSPKGRRYTIIETNQTDPYDAPAGTGGRKRPKQDR